MMVPTVALPALAADALQVETVIVVATSTGVKKVEREEKVEGNSRGISKTATARPAHPLNPR